jgi:hypothetical protein
MCCCCPICVNESFIYLDLIIKNMKDIEKYFKW